MNEQEKRNLQTAMDAVKHMRYSPKNIDEETLAKSLLNGAEMAYMSSSADKDMLFQNGTLSIVAFENWLSEICISDYDKTM